MDGIWLLDSLLGGQEHFRAMQATFTHQNNNAAFEIANMPHCRSLVHKGNMDLQCDIQWPACGNAVASCNTCTCGCVMCMAEQHDGMRKSHDTQGYSRCAWYSKEHNTTRSHHSAHAHSRCSSQLRPMIHIPAEKRLAHVWPACPRHGPPEPPPSHSSTDSHPLYPGFSL